MIRNELWLTLTHVKTKYCLSNSLTLKFTRPQCESKTVILQLLRIISFTLQVLKLFLFGFLLFLLAAFRVPSVHVCAFPRRNGTCYNVATLHACTLCMCVAHTSRLPARAKIHSASLRLGRDLRSVCWRGRGWGRGKQGGGWAREQLSKAGPFCLRVTA